MKRTILVMLLLVRSVHADVTAAAISRISLTSGSYLPCSSRWSWVLDMKIRLANGRSPIFISLGSATEGDIPTGIARLGATLRELL